MREHAVGFKHVKGWAGQAVRPFEHRIDLFTQGRDRRQQARFFGDRVVAQQVLRRHRHLVQNDNTQRNAVGEDRPLQPLGLRRRKFDVLELFVADQLAGGDDLGQHHGDDLEVFDLFFLVTPRRHILHDQNTDGAATAQKGHAKEGAERVFTGFRTIGEARVVRGIHQVERGTCARHFTDQAFAEPHARLVDGVGIQAFGSEQFQFFGGAAQIDRADFGDHGIGDDPHDGVETRLGGLIVLHDFADLPQQSALAANRHCLRHPVRPLMAT